MPETSFNNMLAQRPDGKQKRSIIQQIELGVFVSQAHNVICNAAIAEGSYVLAGNSIGGRDDL